MGGDGGLQGNWAEKFQGAAQQALGTAWGHGRCKVYLQGRRPRQLLAAMVIGGRKEERRGPSHPTPRGLSWAPADHWGQLRAVAPAAWMELASSQPNPAYGKYGHVPGLAFTNPDAETVAHTCACLHGGARSHSRPAGCPTALLWGRRPDGTSPPGLSLVSREWQ